jgi:hypothetical protein
MGIRFAKLGRVAGLANCARPESMIAPGLETRSGERKAPL